MPLVSVVMITYGHEKYITDAINGVLKQQCDFDFELIIANDNSPDETDAVVMNILAKSDLSDKIKYIRHSENIGMMPNFLGAIKQSTGKYVALCEGDDFWTDPLKLHKQVLFMDNNDDFVMCFHPVDVYLEEGVSDYVYKTPHTDVLTVADIIRYHYIPTCSLLFRNAHFELGFPSWLYSSISGDIPLEILLATHGKTKYIDQKMACYRRNPGSISQSQAQIKKMRSGYILMFSNLAKSVGFPHSLYLKYKVWRLKLGYIKAYFKG